MDQCSIVARPTVPTKFALVSHMEFHIMARCQRFVALMQCSMLHSARGFRSARFQAENLYSGYLRSWQLNLNHN